MKIFVRSTNELAGSMEITKYPNSPLIKSSNSKKVLTIFDGDNEFILGYITKSDTSNPMRVYSQFISGSIGHVLNDVYNNVQNSSDVKSVISSKKRTVLKGYNQYIGTIFHNGDTAKYGFENKSWFVTKDYVGDSGEEAPLAPNYLSEAHFISLDNGNKLYQSSSGTLQEINAMRINIGLGGTDIHSYGTWDKTNLTVETPDERAERAINEGTYASGARKGFPDPQTFHIYNFTDNSSFLIGKQIIEMEKSNNDNTIYSKTVYGENILTSEVVNPNGVYSKTVYDQNGVLIEVSQDLIVKLKVDTAEFIIDKNNVHITGATLNYHGDLYVDGDLIVSGASTLETTLNVTGKTTLSDEMDVKSGKVKVNALGKLVTTGGVDLA